MRKKFYGKIKKIVGMVLVIGVILSFSTGVFAQYYQDVTTGISFVMSDDWAYSESTEINENDITGSIVNYSYRFDQNELVSVEMEDLSVLMGYGDLSHNNTENLSDEFLFSLCETEISDEAVSNRLSNKAGVKSESMITSRENIAGIEYFRAEKAFTATKFGYNPFYGYITVYVAVQDGKLVTVNYVRSTEANHFTDVYSMMQTITIPSSTAIVAQISGTIGIVMNGEYIYPDSPPIMQNDRVLVPIRAVAEKMGYNVGWEEYGSMQCVSLKNSTSTNVVKMYIGDNTYMQNGSVRYMDVAPAVIGDYTYIPLRAAAEALGATVNWDDAAQTVYISY